jgi:hypothetical protein
MELRHYQAAMVDRVVDLFARGEHRVALISPTGSGKSLVARAVAWRLCVDGWCSHVVIAVPMAHILSSFAGVAGFWISDASFDDVSERLFITAHHGQGTRRWLRAGMDEERDMAVTHAALVQAFDDRDTTGRLLIIDEGHHAAEADTNKISDVRDRWLARGGSVLLMTATPFRNDRAEVLDASWHRVERSLAEHIAPDDGGPYGPPELVCRTFTVDGFRPKTKDALRDGTATGERSQRQFADQLVAQWVTDGRPKTIMIVPAYDSRTWAADLLAALVDAGVAPERVLDGTGTAGEDRRRTRARLDRERDVAEYVSSTVDVAIGCRRFDEGSDWPVCSHVYVVGYPRSVPLTLQRWGRAFRSKASINYHPFPTVASLSFFVPQWTDELREDAGADAIYRYRDDALLLAACLNDHTALHYAVEGKKARRAAFGEHHLDPPEFDPMERAQAIAALAKIRAKHKDIHRAIEAIAAMPTEQACAAFTVLGERVSSPFHQWLVADAMAKAAKAAATDERRGELSHRSLVAEHIVAEFRVALAQVDATVLVLHDPVLSMCAEFTGQTMAQIGEALRSGADKWRSLERFDAEVFAFSGEHGRPPKLADGVEWRRWGHWLHTQGASFRGRIQELGFGFSMDRVAWELRQWFAVHGELPGHSDLGWRENAAWLLRNGSSTSALAKATGLPATVRDSTRTVERFQEELRAFVSEHGRYPTANEPGGWRAWWSWIQSQGMQWSDFTTPSGRSKFARKAPRYTMETIHADVSEYIGSNGRAPRERDSKKWMNINAWLRRNGSSLHKLGMELEQTRSRQASRTAMEATG